MKKRETMFDSSHGPLPARRILDCIFALAPTGKYIHKHIEEFDVVEGTDDRREEVCYRANDSSPTDTRERCQIIPPMVREFDPPAFPSPHGEKNHEH